MAILSKISIVNKSIKYKMSIAFSLMTVIPLLAFLYAVYPDIFQGQRDSETISLILFLSVVLSVLGLIIARKITNSVVDMAIAARKIASGEYERKVAESSDDELGNLSQSINSMSQKIKSNLDELKSYGQSMKDLNINIHKKVLALSSLLQIGDIISTGTTQIDTLLNLALEKASHLFDTGYGILYVPRDERGDLVMKTSYNIENEALEGLVIKRDGRGIFGKVIDNGNVLQIDSAARAGKEVDDFRRAFNISNLIAVPLYSGKSLLGLFVLGNNLGDYKYAPDDVDLVCVFAKHITMAIESDNLNKRNEKLVTRDDLTGLFNKSYIMTRLEEEIKRAIFYQRPCSFIVLNLDNFKAFREARGELVSEEALRRIAKVIRDNTSPIGKAARIGGDEFAMLLPEKNKREAAYIAEELRKKIESSNVLKEGKATITTSIGVSENPIDGVTSEEIFKRAEEAVKEAKAAGRNRVVS